MKFVVDRVLPGMTAELLVEVQQCLSDAAARVSRDGRPVRYLRCTFLPTEQRCLDLFEATSAPVVRRVNDVAQVPFRWIGQAWEYEAPGNST